MTAAVERKFVAIPLTRATLHRREMNRTEEKYSRLLQERLLVGEIRWWGFESWKFRLADKTYYTPDFIVVTNDLCIEAHEVKTVWDTGKPGWQEDARIKIKVAAEMHPVKFVAATANRDGSWEFEEFLKDREEPQLVPTTFAHIVQVEDKLNTTVFDTEADRQRAHELVRFACGLPHGR